MDVYVNQILGSSGFHDSFYTNDQVKTAFKNYVKTFVTRYLNEPTILVRIHAIPVFNVLMLYSVSTGLGAWYEYPSEFEVLSQSVIANEPRCKGSPG